MLLYGLHDREGRSVVPAGGWCLDLQAMEDNPAGVDYASLRADLHWLVRVDWSNRGGGTYPVPDRVEEYLDRAIRFVTNSKGAFGFILGNEPNHAQERPEGVYLDPKYVAYVFSTVRNAVKRHNSSIRLFTPGLAPYNDSSGPWDDYGMVMYSEIERLGGADGITLHAYNRGSDPNAITSEEKSGPPLDGLYWSFRTYRDQLSILPSSFRSLPAVITEFDELSAWEDRNTGVVKAAYHEIADWNGQSGTQKVQGLLLYRFPHYDQWYIDGKMGVIQDFNEAVSFGYQSPEPDSDGSNQIFIPIVEAPDAGEPSVERIWDPEAVAYGVTVADAVVEEGKSYWFASEIGFLNEQEAGGRHHFYFDVRDEAGNRLVGLPIFVWWSTDDTIIKTEEKPGEEWSANFPFSPGKNAFNAKVNDGLPSDSVLGAGMGQETPSGFNAGIHTCVTVKYVRKTKKSGTSMPPTTIPTLVHPVLNVNFRRITQYFGENQPFYSRFKVDGVPLKGHNGLDFGTPVASQIVAVDTGDVVEVLEDPKGYGKYVKLRHAWGETLYAHLSSQTVAPGRRVSRGELVGYSGNTGLSTGPHLHFGMRINPYNRQDGWGGYTDPLPYLSQEPVSIPGHTDADLLRFLKDAGKEFGLEWQLLASLAQAESSFGKNNLSPAGAKGLLQVGDMTWKDWASRIGAKDINNPKDNARVGAVYLKNLLTYYNGDLYKALWAYNAGPGNVDKGIVPAESKVFANKVVFGRDLLNSVGT